MADFDLFLFFGVSSLIIASFTIIGNCLNLFAFFRENTLRGNPSNNFIIALAVSDLTYGLYNFFFLGISYAFGEGYPYGEYGCMVAAFTQNSFVVSNLLLIAISVDKVLLVALSYTRYVKFQTRRTVAIMIAVCYITGLSLGTVELGIWRIATKEEHIAKVLNFDQYCLYPSRRLRQFGLLLSFGFYLIPISTILILSVVFFVLLLRKIKHRTQVGSSSIESEVNSMRKSQEDEGSTPSSTRNRYVKPAVTLGVLVGAMAISNIPYCTYIILVAFCKSCKSQTLVRVFVLMSELNALLDPLFYAMTQRKLTEFYGRKIRRVLDYSRELLPVA